MYSTSFKGARLRPGPNKRTTIWTRMDFDVLWPMTGALLNAGYRVPSGLLRRERHWAAAARQDYDEERRRLHKLAQQDEPLIEGIV
jgi:hypothetical protein